MKLFLINQVTKKRRSKMFKKLGLFTMFLVIFTAMSLASVGGESKYVKLYVFDAGTNGPVTNRTTHINAFVDFIDLDDYKKSEGIPVNNNLLVSSPTDVTGYYVNDLQNNPGTIHQLKIGDIGPKGFTPGNFNGNMLVYLGEYAIAPSQYPYFKGGAVIQFNFTLTSGTGTNSTQTDVYASEVVPFYQDQH
jgi:hypothetical protein